MGGLLILFPGQGSQYAGMAEHLWDFPVARATFAEAGEVLGWDIGELCRHGSMEELTRTDRTQLTILTCSVAVWRLLGGERRHLSRWRRDTPWASTRPWWPRVSMTFADALRVVDVRGRGMQACGEERRGTMAAIIGLETGAGRGAVRLPAGRLARQLQLARPGGHLGLGGVGAGGRRAGQIPRREAVLPLPVSGAFHTPFMAGAAESLAQALAGVAFTAEETQRGPGAGLGSAAAGDEGRRPVLLHHRGAVSGTGGAGRGAGPAADVAGEVHAEHGGAPARAKPPPDRGLEVGPGNVLTGLMKRIARDFPMASTGDADSLHKALEGLA